MCEIVNVVSFGPLCIIPNKQPSVCLLGQLLKRTKTLLLPPCILIISTHKRELILSPYPFTQI